MTIFNLKHEDLIKSASYASVTIAIIIMVIKSYGWVSTDSQSILASLIDSFLDVTSSFINVIAVRVALTPPDKNHRFGHEKFQDLAIFSQSIFFLISCFFILFSSSKSLYLQEMPENPEFGMGIMYICIFLTLILVIYQTYVYNKTKSKIIAADKLHYFSDFLSNIAVVVSLYLSSTFWYIDAVMGIFIALYIMKGSVVLFREAIRNLSDEEFEPEDREKIIKIINNSSEVRGFHDLKTRSAGNKPFIQFHLDLDGSLTLKQAHDISEKLEKKLMKKFPKSEVTIHQDPV
ncbi:MAG: hypothetical protein DGJ47_000744 [Rickettsiaceae bacterium]